MRILLSIALFILLSAHYTNAQTEEMRLYTIDYKVSAYSGGTIDKHYDSTEMPYIRYEIYTDKVKKIIFSDTEKTIISKVEIQEYNDSTKDVRLGIDSVQLDNGVSQFFDSNKTTYYLNASGKLFGSYVQLSDIEIDFLFNEKVKPAKSKRGSTVINLLPDTFIKKYKKLPKTIALQVVFPNFPLTDVHVYMLFELDEFQDHR